MAPIPDHPLRYSLSNELHTRPFPSLEAPCRAVYLAIKKPKAAAARDKSLDLDHLKVLLDRYGTSHPQPGATHFSGQIGQHTLKWEQHTEFVTYTVFLNGVTDRPFDASDMDVFPDDWLASAPGVRVTSALIRVEQRPDEDKIAQHLADWFVPESLAVSRVIDAKISRDDCLVIDHPAHGKAFGHEPIGKVLGDLVLVGALLDPDKRRCDAHPRCRGQPVIGEHIHVRGVERPVRHAVQENRVGDEFGVLFPFQRMLTDLAREMRGARLRMRGAIAIEQHLEMVEMERLVPRRRRLGFLDRQIDRAARRLERRKRPCVQFVRQAVTQRVVWDRGHGSVFRISPRLRSGFLTSKGNFQAIQYFTGIQLYAFAPLPLFRAAYAWRGPVVKPRQHDDLKRFLRWVKARHTPLR